MQVRVLPETPLRADRWTKAAFIRQLWRFDFAQRDCGRLAFWEGGVFTRHFELGSIPRPPTVVIQRLCRHTRKGASAGS